MNGNYSIGDTVFEKWTLVRLLGEGSYGKVFEAHRVDFGETYRSAVKIMTIPQNYGEVLNAIAEGMDDRSLTTYFRGFVDEMVQEFALMAKLQGTANVVSYMDHMVVEHQGSIGWDILIRMELLTPMNQYLGNRILPRDEVVKIGIDMCRALELCARHHIIHRDIKPENMFVSENGDYKLGDFGVARTMERSVGVMSTKGTVIYMAPEILRNEVYGADVDIYSLGIVLYRLLNQNRTPFLPAVPKPILLRDREQALRRRLEGEILPKPADADDALSAVVLKACAFRPEERYQNPQQMREDLEALLDREQSAGGKKGTAGLKKQKGKESTRQSRNISGEKEGSAGAGQVTVGVDVREHKVHASGFQAGQAKLLYTFPIPYEKKKDLFLQQEQFDDLIDTLMPRLFELFHTGDISLLFCVPDDMDREELAALLRNIERNRLSEKGIFYETDAVAYAARYRGLVGTDEEFLVGAAIDDLDAAARYVTRRNRIRRAETLLPADGRETPERPADRMFRCVLAGEAADCEELLGKLRQIGIVESASGGTKQTFRYHNWVTIGMALLAGQAAGLQNTVFFQKEE